jgi:hypothetical protein
MPLTPDGQQTKPTTDPMAIWIATMRGIIPDLTTDQMMHLTRNDATTLQVTLLQPPIK